MPKRKEEVIVISSDDEDLCKSSLLLILTLLMFSFLEDTPTKIRPSKAAKPFKKPRDEVVIISDDKLRECLADFPLSFPFT